MVGLLDLGERFRLVANDITVVPPMEELPKLPVACAVWEPAPGLATSAECWLIAEWPPGAYPLGGAAHPRSDFTRAAGRSCRMRCSASTPLIPSIFTSISTAV